MTTSTALAQANLDRNRPLRSRTFAAGLNPAFLKASGVSSATWWQLERVRRSLLADKLAVADLGTAGFKILGHLVIIMRHVAQQCLQIAMPCHLGQLPQVVRALAVVACAVHVFQNSIVR